MAASRTGPPTNYNLSKLLGEGGYGTVHLCCDKDTGEEIAVKTVKVPGGGETTDKQMLALEKEIKFLTSYKHERIVQYYGCVNSPTDGFMIFLEYMPGGSLADQIKRDGPLTETLTLKYTEQVLEGLAYLHSKRVMHRDIKGGNVLRDTKGNVKLADFGQAKQMSEMAGSLGLTPVGTLRYMAPEVFTGRYDFKADIWSVGCIVVEMLTGKPPNEGLTDIADFATNPKADYTLPPETSEKTKTMLNATFKPSAEDRPSASELLERFFGQQQSSSPAAPGLSQNTATPLPIRILILSKTGNESTLGDLIMGKDTFTVDKSSCTKEEVVGTLDISEMDEASRKREFQRWHEMTSPNLSAIILVLRCNVRFTHEESEIRCQLKEVFGEDFVAARLIVALTSGDRLDNPIELDRKALQSVMRDAKMRNVLFNEKCTPDEIQVSVTKQQSIMKNFRIIVITIFIFAINNLGSRLHRLFYTLFHTLLSYFL